MAVLFSPSPASNAIFSSYNLGALPRLPAIGLQNASLVPNRDYRQSESLDAPASCNRNIARAKPHNHEAQRKVGRHPIATRLCKPDIFDRDSTSGICHAMLNGIHRAGFFA
jgi:hypothetical protein